MFIALTAFLSIFQIIYADDSTNTVVAANIYDDNALKEITHRLDLLQTAIENLRLRMDSQNLMMGQHFAKQQNGCKNDMDHQFTKQQNEFQKIIDQQFTKHQVDIKEVMDQQFTKQENTFGKVIEDLKLAFNASKEPLTSAEPQHANLTDIRSYLTNQHQNINQSKPITNTQTLPANCDEALENGGQSGLYEIKISKSKLDTFTVYCLSHIGSSELEKNIQANNSWMIVQRRQDGTVDFNRNWTDYQHGFGDLKGEFFIGLDRLHELTQSTLHELWIELEDFEGSKRWAKYSRFAIDGKNENYTLNSLGDYTGDAGDSLSYHVGQKWTTKDVDNDENSNVNCAEHFSGAWWYKSCHKSNLNGEYLQGKNKKFGKGIVWRKWYNYYYSLKYVHMAIRPVQ